MGPASRRHLARDAPGAPEGSQELFYSHSRRAGAPRRLPEAVLQPFQGGRGPQKAPRNGFTTFPGGYEGPRRLPGAVLQAFPGGGGPQKVPRSGFATILYSLSRGHSRRVGAPRRLPGHPEGSQERFCSHSKVVGAPEGPWRRDGGGGFALLTTPYEGFVPFNQPLQGFWACRWPAPRRSGFNQPLRGGLSRLSQVVKSDANNHPNGAW